MRKYNKPEVNITSYEVNEYMMVNGTSNVQPAFSGDSVKAYDTIFPLNS